MLSDDRGVGGRNEPRAGVTRKAQHEAVVAALKLAASIAEDAGLTLLVEPLNSVVDHKGYFLDRTPEGLDIIEEVDHPAVALLYDLYHSTMMGERLDTVLGGRGRLVGYVHVSDAPGRREPGSGTIDWPASLTMLKAIGYGGAIGLEYWPTGATGTRLSARARSCSDGEENAASGPGSGLPPQCAGRRHRYFLPFPARLRFDPAAASATT